MIELMRKLTRHCISALIVRLITGRFIGEYDPSMEAVYTYTIPLPGYTLPIQVMDTAGQVSIC